MARNHRIAGAPAFSALAIADMTRRAGIQIAEHHNLGIATVTLRRAQRARFGTILDERFGVRLLNGPRVSSAGDIAFVGTGFCTYLAVKLNAGWRFADELRSQLDDSAWVCSQFSGYGVLRTSGPRIRTTLAKGIPIALDPINFGPNDAAVTAAARVRIVIWQIDREPTFDIAVPRCFAASFAEWLGQSVNEEGCGRAGPWKTSS